MKNVPVTWKDTSDLYFECHVTIDPIFGEQLEQARDIASKHSFSVADLLMQKRLEDTPERSKYDTFMTSRNKEFKTLVENMEALVKELKVAGFKIRRYKLEDTIFDSKLECNGDFLHILGG